MTTLGQLSLLIAFVAAGYAAFACLVGWQSGHHAVRASGLWAVVVALAALTGVSAILAWALLTKDFRFEYVVQYSDALLPWHYSLSAFWVGQAGSLLLWAWFLAVLAALYRFWPARQADELRDPALGVLMACLWFLLAVMVFAADPMQPSLVPSSTGSGLSPLLQHPAMLVHPPIVFLGYAAWAVPFALAVIALLSGRRDAAWARAARPWALFAWVVLGGGILLGADWAYEELGWGGYWGWDPVENGSLIPWLTGTALIHCLMAWKYTGVLKKTALALAIATFGLCNFATFLTRSGIFSSLHEFSQSPIGWMFLAEMLLLAAGGGVLLALRRSALVADRPIAGVASREALVLLATVALLLLASVALVGTLTIPLSGILPGPTIAVGPAFYNNVLIPTGLCLLALTAAAPLVRWGGPPTATQKKLLLGAAVAAAITAGAALACGVRHPIALAVAGLAALVFLTPMAAMTVDAARRPSGKSWLGPLRILTGNRRQYAGFLVHVSFACLAVGVAGSSLGARRHELVMTKGETISWAGREVRYVDLIQEELPGKLLVQARLDVAQEGAAPYTLLPAQHLYRPQNEWTTEVAIHSTFSGDFYTILHGLKGENGVSLTLLDNPMMRWLWLSGWIGSAGALMGLWPVRQRSAPPSENRSSRGAGLQEPHWPVVTRQGSTHG